jgi:membrane protein implicated in regulation of membrane protease activity
MLDEPIEIGFGKMRVGDSLCCVTGGEAATGTRVRATGVDGVLVVEPVD